MPLARFAAAAVAASAVAGSTLAADLVPPQYLAPLSVFSWTGFNIGIDGGFGGGVIDADTILFQPPIIIGGVTSSPGSVSTGNGQRVLPHGRKIGNLLVAQVMIVAD